MKEVTGSVKKELRQPMNALAYAHSGEMLNIMTKNHVLGTDTPRNMSPESQSQDVTTD